MRVLLFVPLVLVALLPPQTPESSAVVSVMEQRWAKVKLSVDQAESATVPPVAAVLPPNRSGQRTRREPLLPGERDPVQDTIDARSAALEKNVQQSRTAQPIDGFSYRTRVKNSGSKAIEGIFWEYQFRDAAGDGFLSRRQFLCGVSIKPDKEKELKGFSVSAPVDVVNVATLAKGGEKELHENVVINRVEFTDGTAWQRKNWNYEDIKLTYKRAMRTPWVADICKEL